MRKKKIIASLMAASVVATTLATTQPTLVQAATKLKVSVTKCTLQVGKTKKISANKKVTWKSSDKKVATVKKVNGKKATITALKKGTCKITASTGKKKSVIKVTVKKSNVKYNTAPTVSPQNVSGEITSGGAVSTNTPTTSQETPKNDTQVYMNETCGVSIRLSDVTTTSGTIAIKNNSGSEVSFGMGYSIEKFENDQWTKMDSHPVAIPDIAAIVYNGQTYTSNLNWSSAYGSLAQGTYRVVKQVTVEGQGNKNIASQFVIDENTKIGATSKPTTTVQPGAPTEQPVAVPPQTADPVSNGSMHTLSPEEKEKLEHAIPVDNTPTITGNPTTSQETSHTDPQVYMDETCGVSISFSDVTTTGGTITIANNSGNNVVFGLDYSIEKYENGQWTKIVANSVEVPAIAAVVFNEKTYKGDLNWSSAYGSLAQGTYRVVKQVTVDGQGNKNIASQFVIDENTEIGATSKPTTTVQPGMPTATPSVALLETSAPAATPVVERVSE